MPKDWAVILMNAPLFSQKTGILDGLVVNSNEIPGGGCPLLRSGNVNLVRGQRQRRMIFVLEMDRIIRIINPKYYDNSRYPPSFA
jgi:hypothetical protein